MGTKKVYLGDFNNYKKEELLDKAVDYLEEDKGDNFLYILPNGSLLTRYRKYMIDRVELSRGQNIYTFDDIADRLAKRVNFTRISDKLKEIFIEDIIDSLNSEERLNYHKNMVGKTGFIRNMSDIISQMKSSLIRSDAYMEGISQEEDFLEIGYIYAEYEKMLNKYKLMDSDDKFLHTIDGLKENYEGFLENIDFIIIDEFYDFRPQELAIIEEISKLDIDIFINMPFNREGNFKAMTDTIDYLETLDFDVESIEKGDLNYFEELANNIFSDREIGNKDCISLIKAPTKRIEIKKIAEIIKKEISNGLDLKDMAIVMTSENYKDIIFEIFNDEKIPHSRSMEETLTSVPLIREVFYLLDNSVKKDKKSFINRLKSRYFSLCPYEYIEEIEHHFRNRCLSLDNLLELHISEDIDMIIGEMIGKIRLEDDKLSKKMNIRDYSTLLLEIISGYEIEAKIYEIYMKTRDYDLLYRDLSALEILRNSLENIIELEEVAFKEIELEEFIDILYEFLEGESLIVREGNNSGIKILTPAMIRGHRYKLVFIIGMTQGEYPSLSSKNFFFKDENSELFEKINLQYRNYYDKLDKEAMNFTIAISQVEERLYLSYSENTTDNDAGIPSIFLDELVYNIKGDNLGDKLSLIELGLDYNIKKDISDVTTLDDFSYYILNRDRTSLEEYSKLNYLAEDRLRNIRMRSQGELKRLGGLNEYSGILSTDYILEDINKKIGDRKFSISFLENYGRCPYFFMLRSLLKIDDLKRDIDEFTKLDRGLINHSVLQDFYSSYEREIEAYVLDGEELDLEGIEDYLIRRYELGIENVGLDIGDSIYRLKIETNVRKIFDYIISDLDRLKGYKEKLLPVSYETEFGRKEEFYIESRGKKIRFTGVIDRIDKFIDRDEYVVMDYKNSSYGVATDEQVKIGSSLQMPVYIMSQKDKKIVGAIYGVISDKNMEILLIDEKEKSIIGRKRKGIYSASEIDEIIEKSRDYIGEYVERIERGDFRVEPKECSDYCEYRNICRVRKDMEVGYDE